MPRLLYPGMRTLLSELWIVSERISGASFGDGVFQAVVSVMERTFAVAVSSRSSATQDGSIGPSTDESLQRRTSDPLGRQTE